MKKICFLNLVLILLTGALNAQFAISTGIGLLFGKGKLPANYTSYSSETEAPNYISYGVSVYPRYAFYQKGSMAITAGIPAIISLNGGISSGPGSVNNGITFNAYLPVAVDVNFGLMAAGRNNNSEYEDEQKFGGFIGGGFGYQYSNIRYAYYTPTNELVLDKQITYGPFLQGGVRANVNNRIYEFKALYQLGLEKLKYKSIGITFGTCF
jgi:hypothetical protein